MLIWIFIVGEYILHQTNLYVILFLLFKLAIHARMVVPFWLRSGSSVGSDAGCQCRCCEFEPSLDNILSYVWQKSPWKASFVFHQTMWKSSQLLGKNVVWSTGVRKSGNTWVGELAAVIWLNFFFVNGVKPKSISLIVNGVKPQSISLIVNGVKPQSISLIVNGVKPQSISLIVNGVKPQSISLIVNGVKSQSISLKQCVCLYGALRRFQ